MNVQPSTVAFLEAAASFPALLAEYGAESAISGLPPPAAKMEQYRQLEAVGILHVIAATLDDGDLIGLITVLCAPLPHYGGAPIGITESFFVRPMHRKSGAGLRLLKAAEEKAAAMGCSDLLVTAPIDGDLAEVLPRRGFRMTNVVYAKKVTDG
jgi:GNAT superfamily N-acetyltransferase